MAISEAQIDAIVAAAGRFLASGPRSRLEKAMREAFPDVRLTVCSQDDVTTPPARSDALFDLHLIGGTHCLSMVKGGEDAVGVVLALPDED